jgi:hypothetical protein
MKALILAMAILSPCVNAGGAFVSGNGLLKECNKGFGPANGGLGHGSYMACVYYVKGASDMDDGCTPKNSTAGQARDIVFNFLNDHPELRHHRAAYLVKLALDEAYCEEKI